LSASSIALPAISSGIFGYPVRAAHSRRWLISL